MSLFCRTQRKIFWRKFVTRLFWGTIDFHSRKKNTMEVNGDPELLCFTHASEYLPLCSAEQRNSYRFRTTWGWVNDDRIVIFGWTIPLRKCCKRIRAFCSRNEPVVGSVFTHFILCIFLKSGMHLTLRFIFEILMSCIDLISLNWPCNWHNTCLPDW